MDRAQLFTNFYYYVLQAIDNKSTTPLFLRISLVPLILLLNFKMSFSPILHWTSMTVEEMEMEIWAAAINVPSFNVQNNVRHANPCINTLEFV